jgi:hypothetical protein
MKRLLFHYPIREHVESMFQWHRSTPREPWVQAINRVVQERYREQGFQVHWLLFNNRDIAPEFTVAPQDLILYAGLTFEEHAPEYNATGPYGIFSRSECPPPAVVHTDQDAVLAQLGTTTHLRVAGYHPHDCVEHTAAYAYRKGIDVLVDEELPTALQKAIGEEGFRFDAYPGRDLGAQHPGYLKALRMMREEKPWLYQY